MNSLYLHLPICSFTILILLYIPICSSSDPEWYDSCGSYFSCGNISKVGFPFWGGKSRPKKCGYPELELTCDSNVTTRIQIAGMKFQVLNISQNTKTLRIARDDLMQGHCLQNFVNTTLDFKLFDYALGSKNITLFYGCPPPPSYGYGSISTTPGQFTCRVHGANNTLGYPELGAFGPSGCYASVVVPVLASLAPKIGTESLDQILAEGFEATYKEVDASFCVECEASRGRCGVHPTTNKTSCLCPDGTIGSSLCNQAPGPASSAGSSKKKSRTVAMIVAGGLGLLAFILVCCCSCMLVARRNYSSNNQPLAVFQQKKKQNVEALLRNYGAASPRRYAYRDLKIITSCFKDKLGEGGFGSVYRGKLRDGHQVAVKLLKKSDEDAEGFINEVTSIGKTNHINIVRLVGFCYEGQKRALVYDFMPNGSLEKFIYGRNNHQSLAWDNLFHIAVGIARGLEYLHRGCNTRILHFDIKPHNILLDENFCPKISDFGLAKSYGTTEESIISLSVARGTVGYIAPEVFLKSFGGVSQKSDVYSYGMLVLEMIGCRKNVNDGVQSHSIEYFPQWIYKQLEQGEEFDDQKISRSEDRELQRKMVLVSLWCIQTHPSSRPTITRVVEMLEGAMESLQIPPMPSLASPPRLQHHSSTTSTISTSLASQQGLPEIQEQPDSTNSKA